MRYESPGRHRTVDAMRAHLRSIDPSFDCVDQLRGAAGPLAQPCDVPGLGRLGNRFAVQPMEGWDANEDGTPSDLTLRRWRNFGRSGAKLIWGGEAFAVTADGRANPRQLFANPAVDTVAHLARLRSELLAGHQDDFVGTRVDDLAIGLQLTHSGRFSRPDGPFAPRVAFRHPLLDERFGVTHDGQVLTDEQLEAIADAYVAAAVCAQAAGFQFVDVKACHGYLLHELLAAHTREGRHGGSFANRTALLRRIVAGIRRECPGLVIAMRISIADVFPHRAVGEQRIGAPLGIELHTPYAYGFGVDRNDPREFDLSESLQLLATLASLDIHLVNLSLGSPYYCPHLQRPAAYPPSDGYEPPEDPLASVLRHLRVTRACKRAFPGLTLVGTGYSYLQEYLPHVAEFEVEHGHVDFIGLGRMTLVYPELPRDVLAGRELDRRRICRTLSDCTTAPRNGMVSGCFPLDPFYKLRPEAKVLAELKRGGKP